MPSPFPPIADYAFLSNCHTGALVALDGSIDWLCVPRFDSPSVFGDAPRSSGGNLQNRAVRDQPSDRTRLRAGNQHGRDHVEDPHRVGGRPRRVDDGSRDGEDVITPHTRPPADDDAAHMLVRTVRCLEGTIHIDLVCEPVFDYGREPAVWTLTEGSRQSADSERSRSGRCGCAPTWRWASRASRVRARHELRAGDEVFCALSWAEGLAAPVDAKDAKRAHRRTNRFWHNWLSRARIPDHAWAHPIQRSALAIKGMTYMPTGATIAASDDLASRDPRRRAQLGLPIHLDARHHVHVAGAALPQPGLGGRRVHAVRRRSRAEQTTVGCRSCTASTGGVTSLKRLSITCPGYAGARPVRIGNGAFDQRQNDVYGAVLDSILLHTRRNQRLPRRLWPVVHTQAECAASVWRQPDQGIWKARGAPAALRVVQADVLGRSRPRREARAHPRRRRARRRVAHDRRRDTGRDPRARSERSRRAPSALRHRRAGRLGAPGRGVRLPRSRRRSIAQHRAGDRREPHRERVRAALPNRRDRRRPLRQGGHVSDLLVLARLRVGRHRGAATGPRPHGATAAASGRRSVCSPRSSTSRRGVISATSPKRFHIWR